MISIWNECLPKRHAEIHQLPLDQSQKTLYQFYQSHRHTLVWYSSAYWTKTVGVDVLKLQQEFQTKIQARSGCIELLQELKKQGYSCWLVTNADRASLRLKFDNVAIEHFFDVTSYRVNKLVMQKKIFIFGKSSKNYTLSTQKQPFLLMIQVLYSKQLQNLVSSTCLLSCSPQV